LSFHGLFKKINSGQPEDAHSLILSFLAANSNQKTAVGKKLFGIDPKD
jgi:hypothetical protein